LTSREGSRISRANRAPALIFAADILCPADKLQTEAGLARSGEKSRETNLPAEQIGAQAPARFSRAHGDDWRPQGGRGAAHARAQASQCVIG
jgi:hypothetical protein